MEKYEEKNYKLTEQFNGLQGVNFVKDDCADVDTYYTVDGTVDLLNQFADENDKLKSENKRLTDKLNETALEFLNHDMVTMGKATEISEMCYSDFLKFRKENGNPMELQE